MVVAPESGEESALLEGGVMMLREQFGDALPGFDGGFELAGGFEKFGEVLVQTRIVGTALDRVMVQVFGFEVATGVQFASEFGDLPGQCFVAGAVIGLEGEGRILKSLQHGFEDTHPIPIGEAEVLIDHFGRREFRFGLGVDGCGKQGRDGVGDQAGNEVIAGQGEMNMVKKELATGGDLTAEQLLEVKQRDSAGFRFPSEFANDLVKGGIGAKGKGVMVERALEMRAREGQVVKSQCAESLSVPQFGESGIERLG